MKLLHTSDWHLGRTLHGYNLLEDQKYILDQLLTYIKEYKIDALIIAGDVYDKSLPNEEAVALFNWFLGEVILAYHIPTFIIAGNHDSNTRIHFGSELFSGQGLHIVGKCSAGYKCIILEKEEPVNFYLIPYMEPQEVRELAGDPSIKRHDDAMRYLTGKIAEEKREGAKVAVVHAFVAGGDLSDSERRLCAVGTAEMVGVDCFKDFTYTALGHLHKPQAIGNEAVRYSGSPLKYSLSEVNQPKGVTCITIEKGEVVEVEEIPLLPKRNVRLIEGPMAELVKVGATLEPNLKNDYVYARITDRETEDMVGTLRNIYPYILGAEKVVTTGSHKSDKTKQADFVDKRKKSMVELFSDFIDFVSEETFEEEEKVAMSEMIKKIEEGNNEA